MKWIKEQILLCEHYGSAYVESHAMFKIGVSRNVRDRIFPVHGLRHPIEGTTTGWYIWAGDFSDDPDFFVPLQITHLHEWCPEAIRFLGLAPGWRFMVAPDHEDVWEDTLLLNV
jgi:hypothetical protein